jgi:hypothetical protein
MSERPITQYTLLIWQTLPESTDLYLIPNDKLSEEQFKYLHEAQNKMINADDMNDGLRFLNTALAENYAEEGFDKYKGCLREYKWEDNSEAITDRPWIVITNVFLSGFVLWFCSLIKGISQ